MTKNSRKALLLVAVFLFGLIMPNAMAKIKHEDDDCKKMLYAFGILDELIQEPEDEYITRKEFSQLCASAVKAEQRSENKSGNIFNDCLPDDDGYSDIYALLDLGIISKADFFRPDDTISLNECVKIMVSALGYDSIANAQGGYPNGYMNTADKIGLLENVSYDAQVTRKTAYRIIFNSLNINLLTPSSGKNGNIVYDNKSKNTILSVYYNIIKDEGVVEANNMTSISDYEGNSGLSDNYVTINGKDYFVSDNEAAKYLGFKIEFYYIDDDSCEIVYFIPERADELYIASENILDTTEENRVHYIENDREYELKANLSDDVRVIYNGKYYPFYSKFDLMPKQGYLRLYSTKQNGIYDIVYIEDAKMFVADFAEDDRVYLKYGALYNGKNYISCNDDTIVTIDGKTAQPDQFTEWDIIYLTAPKDNSFLKLETSFNRVSGTISSYSSDSVNIDGRKYEINENGYFDMSAFAIGSIVDFYLDVNDRVAAANGIKNAGGDDLKYGYIVKVTEDDDETRVYTTLYDIDNLKFVRYTMSEKVKLYSRDNHLGEKVKKPEALKERMLELGYGQTVNELVMYSVDENKNIIELYYPIEENQIKGDEKYPLVQNCNRDSSNSKNEERVYYQGKLAFAYNLYKTKILQVPTDVTSEKEYAYVPVSSTGYGSNNSIFPNIRLYNEDKNGSVPVGMMFVSSASTGTSFEADSYIGMVLDSSYTLDSDDMAVYRLNVRGNSGEKVLYLDENFSYNGEKDFYPQENIRELKKGDLIQYECNNAGYITKIRILAKINNLGDYRITDIKSNPGELYDVPTTVIHFTYAKVAKTDGGNKITFTGKDGQSFSYIFNNDNGNMQSVVCCKIKNNTVSIENISFEDIHEGDEMMLRWKYSGIWDAYVIREQ
ncbi:MAG: hypothetical protein SOZ34_08490 [Clostridia bacterium]|nr:hypothetical protein [Clostridia bacterium]